MAVSACIVTTCSFFHSIETAAICAEVWSARITPDGVDPVVIQCNLNLDRRLFLTLLATKQPTTRIYISLLSRYGCVTGLAYCAVCLKYS